jgi:hypothetical protein
MRAPKRPERFQPRRVVGRNAHHGETTSCATCGGFVATSKGPPYPSLVLAAVPLAVVEPLKLATIFIIGKGHWITGAIAMLCAYAVSLFVTHRLFAIVKPKLLTLPWFAAMWKRLVAVWNAVRKWGRGKRVLVHRAD